MNPQIKTILLTVLTLSCFVLAMVELSGVSTTALFNKYHIDIKGEHKNETPVVMVKKDEREEMVDKMNKTTIAIDTAYDFGKIKEGAVVKHAFHFTNTGTSPLMIAKAVASCGCTVPEWPKEPIKPGEGGDIVAEFHSEGRPGTQHKNIMIYSNAQADAISVHFTAEVEPK